MNNFFQNKKVLINLSITAAIICLGIIVLINPLGKKLANLYIEHKTKTKLLSVLDKEKQNLGATQEKINQNPKAYEKMLNYLPTEKADNSANFLEQTANISKNNLSSLEYTENKGGTQQNKILNVANLNEKQIKFTLQGNYSALQNFLTGVYNLPQFIYLSKINITADATGALTNSLEGQVIIGAQDAK